MKVICLSCGHKVDTGDAYDDFAGQVKCVACGAVLVITTAEGSLRSVALAHSGATVASRGDLEGAATPSKAARGGVTAQAAGVAADSAGVHASRRPPERRDVTPAKSVFAAAESGR